MFTLIFLTVRFLSYIEEYRYTIYNQNQLEH